MDFILSELQRNEVEIDMKSLEYHIECLSTEHHTLYQEILVQSVDLREIFYRMKINNFGHAMAYLTLVYLSNCSEDEVRMAVQLVSVSLKQINLERYRIGNRFYQRLWQNIGQLFK